MNDSIMMFLILLNQDFALRLIGSIYNYPTKYLFVKTYKAIGIHFIFSNCQHCCDILLNESVQAFSYLSSHFRF